MSKKREHLKRVCTALCDVAPDILAMSVDTPRCCVAAGVAGAAVLRNFGIEARPVFVTGVIVHGASCKVLAVGRGNAFHVVIAASYGGRAKVLDLAAQQFNGIWPELNVPPAFVLDRALPTDGRIGDVTVAYHRATRRKLLTLLSESAGTIALADVLCAAVNKRLQLSI
jgi:hypothetical protein